MVQINVFRFRKTYTDNTTGFLEQLCEELRDLSNNCDDILEHTEIVVVPDEALIPWSQYKHQDAYDPEVEGLVNDELEYQRSQRMEMDVSIPMCWVRQETEDPKEEHWQLRFNGMVIANVQNDLSETDTPWETIYNDHEGIQQYLGNYESLKGGMEAVHQHFGRNYE